MKWSIQQALNLTDDEARAAEIRARRIEEKYRPDGAIQYVPLTEAFALRMMLGSDRLFQILLDAEKKEETTN